jgi:hypothetical protein
MGRQQSFGSLVGQAWSTGKPLFSPGTGKKIPTGSGLGFHIMVVEHGTEPASAI